MKKASYRVLQWTMLMGTAAIMATACVVTSGDGDDDDSFFDGGEGGTGSSTAGKTSTEGGDDTAGTTSGGTATAGTGGSSGSSGSTTGGSAGTGGTGSSYVPGVCQGGDEPTMLPACTPTANDEGEPCTICIKAQCCTEWKTCYGDTPTSACGWGATEDDPGQFDCIYLCYQKGLPNATDLDQLQNDCAGECLNQCENGAEDMGFPTDITLDLVACANDKCLNECFPAQ